MQALPLQQHIMCGRILMKNNANEKSLLSATNSLQNVLA
jgi:hypothetical protein